MSFLSFNLPKNLAHLAHPDINVVDFKFAHQLVNQP